MSWIALKDHVTQPVSADLIRYMCGHEDLEDYHRVGADLATMLILALTITAASASRTSPGCGLRLRVGTRHRLSGPGRAARL